MTVYSRLELEAPVCHLDWSRMSSISEVPKKGMGPRITAVTRQVQVGELKVCHSRAQQCLNRTRTYPHCTSRMLGWVDPCRSGSPDRPSCSIDPSGPLRLNRCRSFLAFRRHACCGGCRTSFSCLVAHRKTEIKKEWDRELQQLLAKYLVGGLN